MHHRFLILPLVFAALTVLGQAPPNYYTPAEGLTGPALRQALHQIIRNHHVIAYSSTAYDTSDALKFLDEDPANTNNVFLLYAQRSEPKDTFGLTTGWNREHQWCDSYGLDGREPAYSDLHNLRAEDANVNSSRGNKYYDHSDPADPNYKSPAHIEAPLCSTDTDSWEPPAAVKGDIARSLFYMAVRYTGDVNNEPALYLTDATNQIAATTNLMGRLSTLLRWHQADHFDSAELLRNDRVYSFQTNRNPFVDHPDWVAAAFIPTLNITRISNAITLVWTNDGPEMLAEQSTTFTSPWTQLTNEPTLTNTNTWSVAVPTEPGTHFFRLRLQ